MPLLDMMSFREHISFRCKMSANWTYLSTCVAFGGTSGSSVMATTFASKCGRWLVGQTNNFRTNWKKFWQSSAHNAKALCGLPTTQGFLFSRQAEKLHHRLLCCCGRRVLNFVLEILFLPVHQFLCVDFLLPLQNSQTASLK